MLIYRWYPHGSKKLEDLGPMDIRYMNDLSLLEQYTMPVMIFHDQEPLDWDLYQSLPIDQVPIPEVPKARLPCFSGHYIYDNLLKSMPNLRLSMESMFNVNDKFLLCHSEKNSTELEKYSDNFIGVYYWSHALIARDWFRYAQYDQSLGINNLEFDFLVYQRAWSGTREYRLKFSELLVDYDLTPHCYTSIGFVDNGIHYQDHQFKNQQFKIRTDLEKHFEPNQYQALASADYNSRDYQRCGIEVVLETLFDDQRHHLTEKTLRPIACGKPFLLVSTPGSLRYLRDYGFETFGNELDESYDNIQDPLARLSAIVQEMKRISELPLNQKTKLFGRLNVIAQRNKTLFFSDQWQQHIVDEFVANVDTAICESKQFRNGKFWLEFRRIAESDAKSSAVIVHDGHVLELKQILATQN